MIGANPDPWDALEKRLTIERERLLARHSEERRALLRDLDARCDAHPRRRAVHRAIDAGDTAHLLCGECWDDVRWHP